jgi:hypothetical protein
MDDATTMLKHTTVESSLQLPTGEKVAIKSVHTAQGEVGYISIKLLVSIDQRAAASNLHALVGELAPSTWMRGLTVLSQEHQYMIADILCHSEQRALANAVFGERIVDRLELVVRRALLFTREGDTLGRMGEHYDARPKN